MSAPSPSSTAGLQVAHQQCYVLEHKADVVTDGKHKIRNRIMDSIDQTNVVNQLVVRITAANVVEFWRIWRNDEFGTADFES